MLNILTDTSKSSLLEQWYIELRFVVLGTNWSGKQRNHSCFSWRWQLWSPLQWAAAPLCAVFDHDVWSQLPTFIWPHDFKSRQPAMLVFPTYSESRFNGIFQENVTLNLRTEQALSSSQCPITHMFKKNPTTTTTKPLESVGEQFFVCHKIIHRSAEQMLTITKRTEAGLWSASKLHFTWVDQGSRQQLFPVSTLGVSDSSFCGL